MIVSAYTDGDKIAEFYDTTFPCSFLRGVLVESREQEKEAQILFIARQEYRKAEELPTLEPSGGGQQ